jgi:hypothetical protein
MLRFCLTGTLNLVPPLLRGVRGVRNSKTGRFQTYVYTPALKTGDLIDSIITANWYEGETQKIQLPFIYCHKKNLSGGAEGCNQGASTSS